MSHENISIVNFDCRFAPNFEFCFDFLKMHDWIQQAKLLTLNLSLVRQVNKNRTTGANLQFLKFNRNVLVTHSYNWLYANPKLQLREILQNEVDKTHVP